MAHTPVATAQLAEGDFRVSSVIRRSAAMLSGHFLTFFIVAVIAHSPTILLARTLTTELTDLDEVDLAVRLMAWGLLGLVQLIVLGVLGEAVIVHAAFQDMQRRPVRLAESLNLALRRFLPIVGVAFVVVMSIRLVGGVALAMVLSVAFCHGLVDTARIPAKRRADPPDHPGLDPLRDVVCRGAGLRCGAARALDELAPKPEPDQGSSLETLWAGALSHHPQPRHHVWAGYRRGPHRGTHHQLVLHRNLGCFRRRRRRRHLSRPTSGQGHRADHGRVRLNAHRAPAIWLSMSRLELKIGGRDIDAGKLQPSQVMSRTAAPVAQTFIMPMSLVGHSRRCRTLTMSGPAQTGREAQD